MSSISALTAGIAGIQKGFDSLNREATRIARSSRGYEDPGYDLSQSLVYMKVAKVQTAASARVVEVSGQMLGTLLDIKV